MIFTFLFACFTGSTKLTDSSEAADDTATSEDTAISIVNRGPEGRSLAQNYCGPADEYFILLDVNVDQQVCGLGLADQNWSMTFNVASSISSGVPISIRENGNSASFSYEVAQLAVDGEITLEFEGVWQNETEYSGYYWVELSNGLIIEGFFDGIFCESDILCG